MIHKILNARTWLLALSSATLLTGHASAQTKTPALAAPPAAAAPAPFKSAFEGYRAFSDDKMTSWKAANDEVARIGGWREYAKQAQNLELKPENTPGSKAGEAKPKATP